MDFDNNDLMLLMKIDICSCFTSSEFPVSNLETLSKKSRIGNSRDLPSIFTITFTVWEPEAQCHDKSHEYNRVAGGLADII